MQWAVWLRVAALHALWEFVALCFAPNPAPALGRLSRSAGGAQADGATASIRAIAGAASGRSVGFGACLTVEAVSLPCF